MFKKGDKYIHFTKYGGINKGEVEFEGGWLVIDRNNGVMYDQRFIKTTKGFLLQLDGTDGQVYKITEVIDENFEANLNKIKEAVKTIKNRTIITDRGFPRVQLN